jgi:catalase (peroxidase I)
MFPSWSQVGDFVTKVISLDSSNILTPDYINGLPYYGAIFVHLAYQSATTFRNTDYLGGPNGARIRFPPESNWPTNVAMDKAIHLLQPIQQAFRNLSWSDLIVFTGNVALTGAASSTPTNFPFCPGRTDASDGNGSTLIQPNTNFSSSVMQMRMASQLIGLSDEETVVLSARIRSPSQMGRMGYYGSWTNNTGLLSNQYFITLLSETWQPFIVPGSGYLQYKALGKELYMVQTDMNLLWDTTYMAYVQNFAEDNDYFLFYFATTWTNLMNIDRFSGPTGNVCNP